ncbi:heparinase II/III family protein [Marinilactibacillus sp. GCM10026970]|uniref:heparinase II/III domain-containing protein n=1 Tax=Marinilactibacillus sp. GCM10026970 TaxID=3252642 RepID=UPI003613E6E7
MLDVQKLKNHKDYDKVIKYFENNVYESFPKEPSWKEFNLFWENGNRSIYEKGYFERRKQLVYLGLLVIDQPRNYSNKSKLEKLIISICNEFTWCLPAHVDKEREFDSEYKRYTLDLFACETAFTLMELSDLLKDSLPENLISLIRHSVAEKVLNPFLKEKWNFEEFDNNWSAVCTGSIGIAALYFLEKDHPFLEKILTRVNTSMDIFLKGYGDDGACLEGLSYWQYGFRYFTYYIDCLNKLAKSEYYETLDQNKLKNIAMFQHKMYLFDRTVINVSDSPTELEPAHDIASYYKRLFPNDIKLPNKTIEVESLIDHCGRWAPMVRTLEWSEINTSKIDTVESFEWLKDAQMLVYKDETIQIVTKGGNNGEPHNHNDLGHFMIFYNNKPFCIDLGAPEYTKNYFNDKRYKTLQASSLGHSVPIINGHLQEGGIEFNSIVKEIDQYKLKVIYDLTHAYNDERLLCFQREIKLNPEDYSMRLKDHFKFSTTNNVIKQRFILSELEIYKLNDYEIIFKKDQIQFHVVILNKKSTFKTEPLIYKDHFGQTKRALLLEMSFNLGKTEEMIEIELYFSNKEKTND